MNSVVGFAGDADNEVVGDNNVVNDHDEMEIADDNFADQNDRIKKLQQLEEMLTQDGQVLPFATFNDEKEKEETAQATLETASLKREECPCYATQLVLDKSLPQEQRVGVCEKCHDTPYKMKWGIKPAKHTVYKKNVTSDQGHPQIIVTKKSTANHPFDNIVITVELVDTQGNMHQLAGTVEEAIKYQEIGETTKFDFKKLKITMTTQQNKGNNFHFLFKLFGEQESKRFFLGCMMSAPIQVYSHKNLLPENRHEPEILHLIPKVLPTEGGQLAIICANVQDSNTLKVKIGNLVISKIPRKNAPVNATGVKVYQSVLVVDIPPQQAKENVFIAVSNKDDKWSKAKKDMTISFRQNFLSDVGSGSGSGPTFSVLCKTIEEALRPLYFPMAVPSDVQINEEPLTVINTNPTDAPSDTKGVEDLNEEDQALVEKITSLWQADGEQMTNDKDVSTTKKRRTTKKKERQVKRGLDEIGESQTFTGEFSSKKYKSANE
jgi:hypothetical protein